MSEVRYQRLPEAERREALQAAALRCGRRTQLLEKDIWVVATLGVLFEAPFGHHLVFKGSTLSMAIENLTLLAIENLTLSERPAEGAERPERGDRSGAFPKDLIGVWVAEVLAGRAVRVGGWIRVSW